MKKTLKKVYLLLLLFGAFLQNTKCQDITTGLVAYYDFESISNGVLDIAGSHDGTNYGANLTSEGKIGNALQFDGTDYVNINSHSDITNYSEFTIAAWICPSTISSYRTIISKVSPSRDFVFGLNGTKLRAHFENDGYKVCYGTSDVQINHWVHALCIWSNNQWKVYYNGVLDSYCDFPNEDPAWDCSLMQIGAMSNGEKFMGKIDEVRVYNRALSQADITALYNFSGSSSSPTLSVNDISVDEDAGTATFTISLNQTTSQTVTGNFTTSNGTATAGSDYTSTSGSFTIQANQLSTTVNVPILDDTSIEDNETFNLTLSNVSNATLGDATGVCTINDNDNSSGDPNLWVAGSGYIYHDGKVSINTTSNPGDYELIVNGEVRAKEVVVETGWADYVFDKDYNLKSLEEIENYIKENKHLPEIPSAKDVEANGVDLGEMNTLLLKKVEELTLHIINQQKEIEKLKNHTYKNISTETRK